MLHPNTPAAQSAVLPPSSNTGGKDSLPPVHVDWLSFTVSDENVALDSLREVLEGWFSLSVALQDRKRGLLGFAFSADVEVPIEGHAAKIAMVAWGGEQQKGRVYVSIPGQACGLIAAERWASVREDLEAMDAKLTRLDLACDDLEGTHSVDVAAEWYRAGDFNHGGSGRLPSHSCQGDWLIPQGKGRTLYIGKAANGKLLRVYEKGKQLGEAESPWVRWELQLGNKDRVIPLGAITAPAEYFAGGYACLSRVVEAAAQRIVTIRHTVTKSLERLVTYARLSYGKLFHALLLESHGDLGALAARLRVRGLPRSLSASWLAAAAVDARGRFA
jgi:phage replication initiation protein